MAPVKLWIPGPTFVRPEILAELSQPMIGHRSSEMTELIERIDPGLRHAFSLDDNSPSRPAVASVSASGMMEAALLGAGDKILAVVGGAFAKRWHDIALSLGKDVTLFEVEWGQPFDDARLADVLDRQGPFDALLAVANETSTGTRAPIKRITEILQAFPDTLLMVDVVSLLGGAEFEFDPLCIDFAFAGVQKAFALPPGISVFCISENYVERAEDIEHRGWFLDALRIADGHEQRSTPATPCIPLYRALAKQVEDIAAGVVHGTGAPDSGARGAWQARFDAHERMRDRTLAWARGHGMKPFPVEELCSPTVSCIRGDGLDIDAMRDGLKERGFQISGGYGPLKGETFRVGHLGDHTEAELEELLGAADEVLAGLGSRA